MRSRWTFALAISAGALILAQGPALAQTASPPPAPVRASALSDAEINVAAEAFRAQVETMNAEVRAATQAAGSNRRRASSRVEDILARYQPGFEGFAVQLEAWFNQRAAAAATDEARASVVQTGAASVARVRAVPDQVRASLAQQPAPARAQTELPRTPPSSSGY